MLARPTPIAPAGPGRRRTRGARRSGAGRRGTHPSPRIRGWSAQDRRPEPLVGERPGHRPLQPPLELAHRGEGRDGEVHPIDRAGLEKRERPGERRFGLCRARLDLEHADAASGQIAGQLQDLPLPGVGRRRAHALEANRLAAQVVADEGPVQTDQARRLPGVLAGKADAVLPVILGEREEPGVRGHPVAQAHQPAEGVLELRGGGDALRARFPGQREPGLGLLTKPGDPREGIEVAFGLPQRGQHPAAQQAGPPMVAEAGGQQAGHRIPIRPAVQPGAVEHHSKQILLRDRSRRSPRASRGRAPPRQAAAPSAWFWNPRLNLPRSWKAASTHRRWICWGLSAERPARVARRLPSRLRLRATFSRPRRPRRDRSAGAS